MDLLRAMVYIAVLRIMQAFTEDFAYCCVTLKVPHLFAVATLLPSVAPSVALLFLRLPLFSFQGAEPALRPEQNTQNRF